MFELISTFFNGYMSERPSRPDEVLGHKDMKSAPSQKHNFIYRNYVVMNVGDYASNNKPQLTDKALLQATVLAACCARMWWGG
jgi:hypothetical protein